MKRILASFVFLLLVNFSFGQETVAEQFKSEIGLDGYFSFGNQGGNFSAGLKWGGLQKKEDARVIIGPSFRWMRVWSKNLAFGTENTGYNIIGLGAFMHARFYDALYLGAEFEMLKSPLNYVIVTNARKWIPTMFLGGGYSKSFDDRFRLNVGIFYDIVNDLNSPYRPSYQARKTGPNGEPGALIPVLYRVQLFIPLG